MRFLVSSLTLVLALGVPSFAADSPAAKVKDLAWMSGHYKGSLGAGSLEENWAKPEGGSIASLVRATDGTKTNMIELIVIEEEGDSLMLRIKQWNPGMQERAEGFTVMKLVEIGDHSVLFENTGSEGMAKLGYTLDGEDFTISVTPAPGAQAMNLPLKKVGH